MIKYPKKPEPIRFEIEPTNACTAKCTFCPRSKMKREIGYINPKKLSEFLDRLNDYRKRMWLNKKAGSLCFPCLVFCGFGEPLLHPKIVDIISDSNSKGFETQLVTNGSLIDSNITTELVEAGLDNIAISLHSLDPELYNKLMGLDLDKRLPRIIQSLDVLKDTNVNVEIWRVSTPDGILPKDKDRFDNFLIPYKNVKVLGPTPAWNRGGLLPDKFWPLVNDNDQIWCENLYFTSNITWNGTAVMCCCDYVRLTNPLGNLWEEPIEFIQDRRKQIIQNLERPCICQVCRRPKDQTYEKTFPTLKKLER